MLRVVLMLLQFWKKLLTCLKPGQIVNLIEFMDKNTVVCTSYEGCLSDEWKLGNWICQGGVTSGILFNV